jgi:hypothetical protein
MATRPAPARPGLSARDEAAVRQASTLFSIVHGSPRADARASAFAVVRDESYNLRAFYDHHRALGVDQFMVLDDHSTDGTREWLAAQPDTVVLASALRYGTRVPWAGGTQRVGILAKTVIPRLHLPGRYALCLDADEYLVLPRGVGSVPALFEVLERHDVRSVAANLVDFFPRTVHEMDVEKRVATAAGMFEAYGYFDASPLLAWREGVDGPVEVGRNASTRLFRKHRVRAVPARMIGAPRWLNRVLPYKYPETTVLKTPVVRWDPGVTYLNSHRTNVAPTRRALLGLAHLKFTYDLSRRTRYALESRAYVRGSRKYQWYEALLDAMRRGDPSFLGPHSRRFRSPDDFATAGLTRFDF